MQPVLPTRTTSEQVSLFDPRKLKQIGLSEFNEKFQENRTLLVEGFPVEYEASKALVAPGVSECIALFAIHVVPATQQIEWACGYHMTIETDSESIDNFIAGLDDENYDLYLYLIGGNEKHPDHVGFYDIIKASLKTFESKDHIVAEQINLINHPNSTSDRISIGLTMNGEVYWCYGMAA